MDAVSRAWEQSLELFRSMTPAARLTTGLLLGVVVVSLTFLSRTQGERADAYLFGARTLSLREINNMQMAFGQAQLNGWELDGYKIKVPLGQRDLYLAALHDANAYPEDPGAASEGLFGSITALETRDVRQLKAKRAKERELEAVLKRTNGIEEAFVSIERSDNGRLRNGTQSHVLISVRKFGEAFFNAEEVKNMRRMGARTAATDVTNVDVFDLNNSLTHGGGGPTENAFGEDAYVATQRAREATFRQKIEDQLKNIPGVLVDVFVALDDNLTMETTSQKFEQPTAIRNSDFSKETTSSTPQFGGRPGAGPNGVGNQGASITAAENAESTALETRNETENVAGATAMRTVRAPLTTQYVQAAISVPWSYYRKVWAVRHPDEDPTDDDLQRVEGDEVIRIGELVRNLLPEEEVAGADRTPRVKVNTYYDLPGESPPGESFASTAGDWFAANWQTLGTFLVAFVGLMMLRGMIRSGESAAVASARQHEPIPTEQLSVYAGEDPEDPMEAADEIDVANSLKARFQHSGRSLRDELTELVREDPDAAANVLQNWIGDAA